MSTVLSFVLSGFSGLLFPKTGKLPKEATERKYEVHETTAAAWKRDFDKIGGDINRVLVKKVKSKKNVHA